MTSKLTSSKYFELIVNLFICNVIEREIEREKVQMKPGGFKPPAIVFELIYYTNGHSTV